MDKEKSIVIYQTEDGKTTLEVALAGDTAWLTQAQMMELFQTSKQNVSLHINNIFRESELVRNAVVKDSLTTAPDGKRYNTKSYNLDVVISVGYRVKSIRGTQFRIWATQRLKEYIIKGFALNSERFKSGNSMNYFNELQEKIREIRLSERFPPVSEIVSVFPV